MTTRRMRTSLGAFACAALIYGACSNSADQLGTGDASWDRPPLDPPGGEGKDEGGDAGGEGGTDGGDSGASGDGGDDGGPKFDAGGGSGSAGDGGGDDGTGGATTGADTSGGDSTGTGGIMCVDFMDCDQAADVCEAPDGAGETGGTAGMPCCDDPDCMCAGGYCSEDACQADGYCDCYCGFAADPDCLVDSCGPVPDGGTPRAAMCPDNDDPVVLYMSNDDSNSQASPAFARRAILEGRTVPTDRIRIHEFLNYYDLNYDNPTSQALRAGLQMRRIDENNGEYVLLLYAQGRRIGNSERRPLNIVFSLDTSGSMAGDPILLLKESVMAAAGQLRAGDVVSVVEWSSAQSVPLESYAVVGSNDPRLLDVVDAIATGGDTDLHGGLTRAYAIARDNYRQDGINRVVLISDGGANAGVTDLGLIAAEADDSNGEGIYLMGVGVGGAEYYNDELMDTVTDAGKGAYMFIDTLGEAHKMFGDRFLANVEVAARDVQMQLTLPWYFGVKEFHGEEYSEDPAEVEPQHLGPNDAMSYHQILAACNPREIDHADPIKVEATYRDPITRAQSTSSVQMSLDKAVGTTAIQLYKSDVVVAYAQALIVIGDLISGARGTDAIAVADNMEAWLDTAADTLGDDEVREMQQLMDKYTAVLRERY